MSILSDLSKKNPCLSAKSASSAFPCRTKIYRECPHDNYSLAINYIAFCIPPDVVISRMGRNAERTKGHILGVLTKARRYWLCQIIPTTNSY